MTNEQIKARDLYNQVQENKEKIRELRDNKKIEQAYNLMNENKKLELELFDIEDKLEEEEREMHINNKVDNYKDDLVNYIRDGKISNNMLMSQNGAILKETVAKGLIEEIYNDSMLSFLKPSMMDIFKGKITFAASDADSAVVCNYVDEDFEGESNDIHFTEGKVLAPVIISSGVQKISDSLIYNADLDIVDYCIKSISKGYKKFILDNVINGQYEEFDNGRKMEGLTKTTNIVNANSLDIDSMIDLDIALNKGYEKDAVYVMNTKNKSALAKIKNNWGQSYLQADARKGLFRTAFGKTVVINDNCPDNEIYLVNFAEAYRMEVRNFSLKVLKELYATQGCTGVCSFAEIGSCIVNNQAIAKMVIAPAK